MSRIKIETTVKTKMTQWLDSKSREIIYGVAVKIGDKDWANLKDDNGPLFYDTKQKARKAMIASRKTIYNHYNK